MYSSHYIMCYSEQYVQGRIQGGETRLRNDDSAVLIGKLNLIYSEVDEEMYYRQRREC